jgi:type IV pilus assembly protein PilA
MSHRQPKLLRRMRGNSLYGPSVFVGIIAAIAIPAYQDYTMRSQVTEGLNLAASVKAAVAEHFAETGKWPRDLRELKFDSVPHDRYVTFAALNHGTVVIRYSSAAGVPLRRQTLTLRPTVGPNGDVIWSCGYMPEQGADPASGPAAPHATTIAPKYLPSACRG